jgi:hypothetical protein
VSKKTNAIYGLNDPKKLKLLNMKPWMRAKKINLLKIKKYKLAIFLNSIKLFNKHTFNNINIIYFTHIRV